jgi:hypothetical protein
MIFCWPFSFDVHFNGLCQMVNGRTSEMRLIPMLKKLTVGGEPDRKTVIKGTRNSHCCIEVKATPGEV